MYRRDMNHPRSQQRWAARGSLKTGHLTLPMVLALVLAPVATSVAGRFTGGDKKRSDCYAEFEVENVATASKVECMDCVIPPELLAELVRDGLRRRGPPELDVVLDDPRR